MNLTTALNNTLTSKPVASILQHRDLIVVLGVVGIIVVMVLPLPTVLLDLLLSMSLCLALVILLVTMYNRDPLEFSAFPSILLVVTLFRLALNIATSRLILSQADAGEVVAVFGSFVTKGNLVVGVVIFIIIMIVQFVVITKGSTRIAEVAARFTLDAMPGKQMAIDADLNAGIINEETARNRREKISREADFYGAMDGASKFVRGDAVAGIIITLINIIGGFIIGIAQLGMSFQESLRTYTLLTIGDGLVSQIPALMISTGAGMVVSRAASKSNLGEELTGQLFRQPKILLIAGSVMVLFALVPGFPKAPFLLLGFIAGIAGFIGLNREKEAAVQAAAITAKPAQRNEEERVESYLHVDPMELEIGYGLIPLVDSTQGGDLLDRITMIRRQLASELGVIIPPIRIRDNIQLKPNEYRIKIRTIVNGKGELMSGAHLAMNPGNVTRKIRGIDTVEPAFGLPALWITESQKETAEMSGYTVVELPAVLATHLTEIIKRHAFQLLTRQDVKTLLDNVKEANGAVVEELTPSILSVGDIHKVLQNLLRERVSIRDLPTILETLADIAPKNKNVDILTEYCRNALAAQICETHKDATGAIPVITIDPALEVRLENSVQQTEGGIRLTLPPSELGKLLDAVGVQIERTRENNETAVLLASPTIRGALRLIIESKFKDLVVLSYNEIIPGIEIRSTGMVSLS